MFRIGLENGSEGRSQAWVLDHPGCFAYGLNGTAAMEAVPQAIQDYQRWILMHTTKPWLDDLRFAQSRFSLKRPGSVT